MPLLTLHDADLAYGLHPLLDHATLVVRGGERIGLVGRNGTGKSSLLGVIAGEIALDGGEVRRRDGIEPIHVEQEPRLPAAPTLRASLAARGHVDRMPDDRERWRTEARLVEFLHRFGLGEETQPGTASGGERKRAALALAFALEPQLLLLDEPTNHLDIEGITLVEELLLAVPTSIVVTHDRAFLDRVATRIVELDRGALRSYPGRFAEYERRRAEQLSAEALDHRRFDKFWAQEEAWIRKGVEARRTRNAGRVQRLEDLRRQRAKRRELLGSVRFSIDAGERSGRLVAELEHVTRRFDDRTVVEDFSMRVMRGDRIGVIGPNGAGKTTLLRLMLGALEPDSGTVRLGANLQVAYFDQMREQLDPEATVAATVSPTSDWVETAAGRRHVVSYLGDFLFPPRRIESPVKMLSGGERNRLLLARLFARPANVLVLDEPTNDLDLDSLELLESTLQEYAGTVLLVSHDRAFLDNVVTQTLAPLGDGRWKEYAGGYADWLAQRPKPAAEPASTREIRERETRGTLAPRAESRATPRPAKLGYKESRELAELPARIEALEAEQQDILGRMSRADYHQAGPDVLRADAARMEEIEDSLAAAYARWEELEGRAGVAR